MKSTHNETDLSLVVAAKFEAADGVAVLQLRQPDGPTSRNGHRVPIST